MYVIYRPIWYDFVKGHRREHEPYKVDVKVKGQSRIEIMNVRDTLSHSDTLMY